MTGPARRIPPVAVRRKAPPMISTYIGLIALALLPVVPMPIAGGTPISIALLSLILLAQLIGGRRTTLGGTDLLLVAISCSLLALELITVFITGASSDGEYAMARIYWIVLLVVVLFFTNAEIERGNTKFIFDVLSIGLAILLAAMLSQSLFYPEYDVGRDFGFMQMPIPRATGVPNSDGKIGTFFAICLCVALFYGKRLGRRKHLFLLIGPFAGLFFTQSRSGLLAFAAILALYWMYRCLSDRNLLVLTLRWMAVICGAVVVLYFVNTILVELVGKGTLETNVTARGHLAQYAYDKIAAAPLFGSGAAAIAERITPVHNTVLAMSVKSGVPAGLLITITLLYPALVFGGNMRFTFFKFALITGFIIEHSLYPGFVNEFIVIGYVVTKWIWRLSFSATRGPAAMMPRPPMMPGRAPGTVPAARPFPGDGPGRPVYRP